MEFCSLPPLGVAPAVPFQERGREVLCCPLSGAHGPTLRLPLRGPRWGTYCDMLANVWLPGHALTARCLFDVTCLFPASSGGSSGGSSLGARPLSSVSCLVVR